MYLQNSVQKSATSKKEEMKDKEDHTEFWAEATIELRELRNHRQRRSFQTTAPTRQN
jgi:hypothetical protein